MSDEEIKKIQTEANNLRQMYTEMRDMAGMGHFLVWLKDKEDQARGVAEADMGDPYRRSLYLQSAVDYATVRVHLETMFLQDAQAHK